jgi:hypothetical protein
MATKSLVLPQVPLLIVQRKILIPTARLLIVVVGLLGKAITPEPETNVHVPTDGAIAAFAAMVALTGAIPVKHKSWSGPAFAI